jgi:TamB, inner membrane protein subunit of TAM complex
VFSGLVTIDATKQAILQLAPKAQLPIEQVNVSVIAAPVPLQPWTHVTLTGTVDGEGIYADVQADIEARRARGIVSTGVLNLTKLSGGKLEGTGTAVVTFDALAPVDATVLPVGGAIIHVAGDIAGMQNAVATIAVSSTGERAATAIIANAAGARAQIGAQVRKLGDKLTLESSRIVANISDPMKASAGKAPVRGQLNIDVSASGALSPNPDLAVTGRLRGANVRAQDIRVGSLDVAIAASHLPSRPTGKAEVRARNIQKGTTFLKELDVNAANRPDGKIAATVRTKPRQGPMIVEADALVTPGETITVDLVRHHVRAGDGVDWRGTTGQIVIGPKRIDIRDLATSSSDGKIEVDGHMLRASGDLAAHVDVASFNLATISKDHAGIVQAKVDVQRTRGKFAGMVDVNAKGVSVKNKAAFDATAKIEVGADKLVVDVDASSPGIGAIALDIDVDAPKDISNVVAWKKLRREAVRKAHLQLKGLDVARLAALANVVGDYKGRIDGDIVLSPTATGGLIQLREISGPVLKNLGPLSANLNISETAPGEITPTLTATIDDRKAAGTAVQKPLAKVELQATLAMADNLFDPAAWKRLGTKAFKGGSLRVEDVMIEPPLLDRMQVKTNIRGRASFVAELSANAETAKAQLSLRQLRGNPIEQPVSVDLLAQIDGAGTSLDIDIVSPNPSPQKLLEVRAKLPVSLAELQANPQILRTAQLQGTATLPDVPAPRMLATFGRTQIIGGTLTGTIDVAGTVLKPTVHARIAGNDLEVPPGPRGKPIKTIKRIGIDATWDGEAGKVTLDATQQDGMLQVTATGNPKQLDAAKVSVLAKQFDLMPLLAFAPGPAGGAGGRLDAKLDVTGLDPVKAKIAGELHLVDGRIPINPAVGTMRRAKIDIVIGEQVKVDLDGRIGGGTIKANATLAMNGALPTGGDGKIYLRKVSPIGVVEPDVSADITAKLSRRPDAWVADLVVDKATIKVPDGRGEPLDPVGMPPDMVYMVDAKKYLAGKKVVFGEEDEPVAPSFIVNIDIKPTYVESTEMRGYIKGKLTIERDAEALGIVGKIEADRGDLDLFGRRYQLDRAVVRFDGSTDPLLDVIILHDFPEVTTRTQVRGRLSTPELVMSSDPGTFSQGQLLGFLLGGEPEGSPADGNPRDKAVGAGASIIANKIGGYVKDALPLDIDVLRYEAATSSSGAAITVGTWISRSLFVAYRRRIEARPDENAGEGEVEYYLTRRIVLEGIVGDRGYNGVDLLWRRRY